ncbi:zinc-dependent metalloprotease [Xylanibacter brevis]|uniref:zinc-dependent metalloprotease n=1 Tax=Xylanibacter brevis TaxID=83231 RepID=UPI0004854DC3|nr:zinc-dependent metalloprotease [Xylanibacter brevis]
MNKTLTTIVALMMAYTAQASTYYVAKADTLEQDTTTVDTLKARRHGKKPTPKKEEKKESEYEKLMKKGGTVRNGLFGVRHIDDKYYFEVPDSMLGRYVLFVTRLTAVPQNFGQFAGEEISHSTVYLERRDTTKLMMRQYVLSHVADNKDNIARTLEQSTVDPIVRSFKIIGRNKEDDHSLIEVTSFLTGDSHLTSFSSGSKGTLKVGGQNKDLTFIDTIKVFPTNIEVATTRTYGSSAGRSEASKTGAMTMAFNTSMVLLPKEPMRKRLWDERVGYFVNNFVRFSDQQHKTQHESFISRYRLVPKNKKKYLRGELTEPEKQIVYYIDPATPKKWIPYLIQGIKDWNVAFEAAGFKNAITAKVLPEDDPNISLEDARYSVLRYLPSETENAYGPRIVDPRSGEIIEAHICWYHNVMNLLTKWYMTQCGAVDKRAQTMHFDDKLMGELIRFVSSHEVGHSLGLRHNMGASFATPVEKLRDKAWVEAHGHTASIMDYARFNYVAQPEDGISEKGLFPRINDYDKWAIKWGYQWRPEFKDEYEEKEQLMTETTRTLKGNPRLWFGGEGRNEDARAQTEDLGDNSVKASEYGIKNLKRIIQQLPTWTHQENDQYEDLNEMYKAVCDQFNRYVNHVMKNIGSRYTNNMPGRNPVEYASAERQKEAVAFIGQQVFDMPEWLYPAGIVSKTATDVANTHQQMQSNLLNRLMTPLMLNNIAATPYPIDAYLADLKATVWKPIGKANDLKAKARRQLQRSYVQHLNVILNPSEADLRGVMGRYLNSDASLYVLMNMKEIETFCEQQLKESSGLNALHYEDLLRQLKLIRERRTTVK